MKESNILAGNASIKHQQNGVLLNTKRQYMKELDNKNDNKKNCHLNSQTSEYVYFDGKID